MNVNYINPFIDASINVLKSFCQTEARIGKLSVKPIEFLPDYKVTLIGMTGEVRGQVFLGFNNKAACKVAGCMMGFEITTVDELAESALSELGNMIMGNTATIFSAKKIRVEITPPTLAKETMVFDSKGMEHVCIPIILGDVEIEMHVALKG